MTSTTGSQPKGPWQIVIATGIYPPEIGGSATFTAELAERLRQRGHRVTVVAYGEGAAEGGVVRVSRRGNALRRYVRYARSVRRAARSADIVFLQDLVSSGLPATVGTIGLPVQRLVRLGGDFLWEQAYNRGWTTSPLRAYYGEPKRFGERIYLAIYRWVLARCARIVCTTAWQRALYERAVHARSAAYAVIENAFPEDVPPAPAGEDPHDVVYVGRLVPLKNIERLAEACRQVPGVRLTVYGEGPLRQALASAGVRVEAALPHDAMLQRLAAAGLVVVPSITEISPNTAYECIAAGIPVLVTKECGMYERWQSHVRWLDPFSVEAIAGAIRTLTDPAERQEYQRQLRQMETSRTFAAVTDEYERLFTDLVRV